MLGHQQGPRQDEVVGIGLAEALEGPEEIAFALDDGFGVAVCDQARADALCGFGRRRWWLR